MCKFVLKSFCFLLLFSAFSVSAFSQENGSPLSVLPPSESSVPDGLAQLLNEPNPQPSPQISPQLPLEKRQALMLQEWIDWYNQEMIWRKKVADLWPKVKSSYEKLDSSRVLQINSRDFEIESLKRELKKARTSEVLSGAGGFAAGFMAGKLIK